MGFWTQMRCLMTRNLLLKIRERRLTIQEIVIPLIMIGKLIGLYQVFGPQSFQVIPPSVLPRTPIFNDSRRLFLPHSSIPLAFAPHTAETENVTNRTARILGLKLPPTGFASEENLLLDYNNRSKFQAALVFSSDFPMNMSYTIRLPHGRTPSTRKLKAGPASCRSDIPQLGLAIRDCPANQYLYSGFVAFQMAVNMAFLSIKSNASDIVLPNVQVQMFPKTDYTQPSDTMAVVTTIDIVIGLGIIVRTFLTILITEKEKKIRDTMNMMGLQNAAYCCAWLPIYGVIVSIISLLLIGVCYSIGLLANSSFFLIFLVCFLYGISVISVAFMMAPLFERAGPAAFFGSLFCIILAGVYAVLFLLDVPLSPGVRCVLCLLPPIACAMYIQKAVSTELTEGGINLDNFLTGDFPPYVIPVMLLVDIVLFFFLANYLENIVTGKYGQKGKSCFYCFMPSFWLPRSKQSTMSHVTISIHQYDAKTRDVEDVPEDIAKRDGIRIRDLTKIFPSSKRLGIQHTTALNDISLDIYEGQITCLLGHNGAGKTTLLNILTGLMKPTSGSVTIYDSDMSDHVGMKKVQGMMGLCPQEDTLFDKLSPREHLRVYAGLKGIPRETTEKQINAVLRQVNLENDADTFAMNLSGGQKRKLSVAMAIIGDPKVVFLDEPSSGMDPYSRRQLWSMLKNQRKDQVILLTTHHMDEADILADRIAVVSKGSLRCCGTSLFLKNRFGIGYHLGMVVGHNCDVDGITKLVQSKVPDARLERACGLELSYTLLMKDTRLFSDLFRALEQKEGSYTEMTVAQKLGIQNYGVSMTTLEEVFLHLAKDDQDDDDEHDDAIHEVNEEQVAETVKMYSSTSEEATHIKYLDFQSVVPGRNLLKSACTIQMRGLFRDLPLFVIKIAIPGIILALAFVLFKFVDDVDSDVVQDDSPLILNPSIAISNDLPLIVKNSGTTDERIHQLISRVGKLSIESTIIDNLTSLLQQAPHSMGIDVEETRTSPDASSKYTLLYNDSDIHSLPVLINIMANVFHSIYTNGSDETISVTNHPLPSIDTFKLVINNLFIMFFYTALLLMPAPFARDAIYEREVKIATQLSVSGLEQASYWGAFYLSVFIPYAATVGISILAILTLGVTTFSQTGAIVALCLFFLFYVSVNIFSIYSFSFNFDSIEAADGGLIFLWMVIHLFFGIPIMVMDAVVSRGAAIATCFVVSVLFPPCSLFGVLHFIDRIYRVASAYGTIEDLTFADYFKLDNIVLPIIILEMFLVLVTFFRLRFTIIRSNGGSISDALPTSLFRQMPYSLSWNTNEIKVEDSDVIAERHRVEDILENHKESNDLAITIKGLRKEYNQETTHTVPPCCQNKSDRDNVKVAVHNLTLSVKKGEVFGLLGPDGAGKTTMLKSAIADIPPTNGEVYIAGHNIAINRLQAYRSMGYCPQINPLWNNITMREHLETYALIKGVHKSVVKEHVQNYMESLRITKHADKKASMLSGGTKRKLCFAMSLLGNPQIVLLDEPTVGIDPHSKRFLWDIITSSFRENRGAIITTHSMEEADAICTRMGIMVSGQLKCIGTAEHLKNKFGNGYIMEVKIKSKKSTSNEECENHSDSVEERLEALDQYIKTLFPNSELIEKFWERVTYKIPSSISSGYSLSDVFAALEEGKDKIGIEEYSFTQFTIEQVFLEFAKHQKVINPNCVNAKNDTTERDDDTRLRCAEDTHIGNDVDFHFDPYCIKYATLRESVV